VATVYAIAVLYYRRRKCLKKVWVAKTVHLRELVSNLDRYKRPILASFMSAVLVISIIFVGIFLLSGQGVSSEGYNYLEIFVDRVDMWNFTMHGPRLYNITTDEGLITLQVTNITMHLTAYSNMLLISCLDGKNLTMKVANASATKVVVYTTYIGWAGEEIYGNTSITTPSPKYPYAGYMALLNVRMKVVYMHAESFSAPQGFNLTFT